jgi:hypothetical protein
MKIKMGKVTKKTNLFKIKKKTNLWHSMPNQKKGMASTKAHMNSRKHKDYESD